MWDDKFAFFGQPRSLRKFLPPENFMFYGITVHRHIKIRHRLATGNLLISSHHHISLDYRQVYTYYIYSLVVGGKRSSLYDPSPTMIIPPKSILYIEHSPGHAPLRTADERITVYVHLSRNKCQQQSSSPIGASTYIHSNQMKNSILLCM